MLEAAQLIFILHSCLHLTSEPSAIGRLDQLLFPFHTADIANGFLNEDLAQEIIDCFWIKLGEKKAVSGKEDSEEGETPAGEAEKKQSKHVLRKISKRNEDRKLDPHLEDQFASGRLLACISSRPGQCGRADGYILEGKELEFNQRKIQRKKGKGTGAAA